MLFFNKTQLKRNQNILLNQAPSGGDANFKVCYEYFDNEGILHKTCEEFNDYDSACSRYCHLKNSRVYNLKIYDKSGKEINCNCDVTTTANRNFSSDNVNKILNLIDNILMANRL